MASSPAGNPGDNEIHDQTDLQRFAEYCAFNADVFAEKASNTTHEFKRQPLIQLSEENRLLYQELKACIDEGMVFGSRSELTQYLTQRRNAYLHNPAKSNAEHLDEATKYFNAAIKLVQNVSFDGIKRNQFLDEWLTVQSTTQNSILNTLNGVRPFESPVLLTTPVTLPPVSTLPPSTSSTPAVDIAEQTRLIQERESLAVAEEQRLSDLALQLQGDSADVLRREGEVVDANRALEAARQELEVKLREAQELMDNAKAKWDEAEDEQGKAREMQARLEVELAKARKGKSSDDAVWDGLLNPDTSGSGSKAKLGSPAGSGKPEPRPTITEVLPTPTSTPESTPGLDLGKHIEPTGLKHTDLDAYFAISGSEGGANKKSFIANIIIKFRRSLPDRVKAVLGAFSRAIDESLSMDEIKEIVKAKILEKMKEIIDEEIAITFQTKGMQAGSRADYLEKIDGALALIGMKLKHTEEIKAYVKIDYIKMWEEFQVMIKTKDHTAAKVGAFFDVRKKKPGEFLDELSGKMKKIGMDPAEIGMTAGSVKAWGAEFFALKEDRDFCRECIVGTANLYDWFGRSKTDCAIEWDITDEEFDKGGDALVLGGPRNKPAQDEGDTGGGESPEPAPAPKPSRAPKPRPHSPSQAPVKGTIRGISANPILPDESDNPSPAAEPLVDVRGASAKGADSEREVQPETPETEEVTALFEFVNSKNFKKVQSKQTNTFIKKNGTENLKTIFVLLKSFVTHKNDVVRFRTLLETKSEKLEKNMLNDVLNIDRQILKEKHPVVYDGIEICIRALLAIKQDGDDESEQEDDSEEGGPEDDGGRVVLDGEFSPAPTPSSKIKGTGPAEPSQEPPVVKEAHVEEVQETESPEQLEARLLQEVLDQAGVAASTHWPQEYNGGSESVGDFIRKNDDKRKGSLDNYEQRDGQHGYQNLMSLVHLHEGEKRLKENHVREAVSLSYVKQGDDVKEASIQYAALNDKDQIEYRTNSQVPGGNYLFIELNLPPDLGRAVYARAKQNPLFIRKVVEASFKQSFNISDEVWEVGDQHTRYPMRPPYEAWERDDTPTLMEDEGVSRMYFVDTDPDKGEAWEFNSDQIQEFKTAVNEINPEEEAQQVILWMNKLYDSLQKINEENIKAFQTSAHGVSENLPSTTSQEGLRRVTSFLLELIQKPRTEWGRALFDQVIKESNMLLDAADKVYREHYDELVTDGVGVNQAEVFDSLLILIRTVKAIKANRNQIPESPFGELLDLSPFLTEFNNLIEAERGNIPDDSKEVRQIIPYAEALKAHFGDYNGKFEEFIKGAIETIDEKIRGKMKSLSVDRALDETLDEMEESIGEEMWEVLQKGTGNEFRRITDLPNAPSFPFVDTKNFFKVIFNKYVEPHLGEEEEEAGVPESAETAEEPKKLEFQQLKYGKIVQRPGGPIVEGSEHGYTGASQEFRRRNFNANEFFPDPHSSMSYPWQNEDGEIMKKEVEIDGIPHIICGRYKLRSENGDDGGGRNYHEQHFISIPKEEWSIAAIPKLAEVLSTSPIVQGDDERWDMDAVEIEIPSAESELPEGWFDENVEELVAHIVSGKKISLQKWDIGSKEFLQKLYYALICIPLPIANKINFGTCLYERFRGDKDKANSDVKKLHDSLDILHAQVAYGVRKIGEKWIASSGEDDEFGDKYINYLKDAGVDKAAQLKDVLQAVPTLPIKKSVYERFGMDPDSSGEEELAREWLEVKGASSEAVAETDQSPEIWEQFKNPKLLAEIERLTPEEKQIIDQAVAGTLDKTSYFALDIKPHGRPRRDDERSRDFRLEVMLDDSSTADGHYRYDLDKLASSLPRELRNECNFNHWESGNHTWSFDAPDDPNKTVVVAKIVSPSGTSLFDKRGNPNVSYLSVDNDSPLMEILRNDKLAQLFPFIVRNLAVALKPESLELVDVPLSGDKLYKDEGNSLIVTDTQDRIKTTIVTKEGELQASKQKI